MREMTSDVDVGRVRKVKGQRKVEGAALAITWASSGWMPLLGLLGRIPRYMYRQDCV
jgi:hypothetical protein